MNNIFIWSKLVGPTIYDGRRATHDAGQPYAAAPWSRTARSRHHGQGRPDLVTPLQYPNSA